MGPRFFEVLKANPTIAYLALYALTAASLAWIHKYRNNRVTVFVDNTNVRYWINANSAPDKNSKVLMRITRVLARYITSKDNIFADHVSCGRLRQFRKESKGIYEDQPTPIPEIIWPMTKVWQF